MTKHTHVAVFSEGFFRNCGSETDFALWRFQEEKWQIVGGRQQGLETAGWLSM